MIFPRLLPTLPLLAATVLFAGTTAAPAQEPPGGNPPPPALRPPDARPGHGGKDAGGTRLPSFLKVDGMYILDGNDEDFVKVTELSETGWIHVVSKSGDSWVNVSNLTTITPVSKEIAQQTELKQRADFILDSLQTIQQGIDDYASKNNLPPDTAFKWQDIRKFIRPETSAYNSAGKDVTGRPYLFGGKIENGVKVNPETLKEFAPVISDPDAYWGKFKP